MIKGIAGYLLEALLRRAARRRRPVPGTPFPIRLSRSLVSLGAPFRIGMAANENEPDGRFRFRGRPH